MNEKWLEDFYQEKRNRKKRKSDDDFGFEFDDSLSSSSHKHHPMNSNNQEQLQMVKRNSGFPWKETDELIESVASSCYRGVQNKPLVGSRIEEIVFYGVQLLLWALLGMISIPFIIMGAIIDLFD